MGIGAIGSGAADGGADRPFYRPTLRLAAIHSVKGKKGKQSRGEETIASNGTEERRGEGIRNSGIEDALRVHCVDY